MSPAKPAKKRTTAKKATPAPHEEAVKAVSDLAKLAEKHNLSEVSVETKGVSLTIRRGGVVAAAPVAVAAPQPAAAPHAPAPVAATPTATADEGSGKTVTSPFVGTFYRSPSPDAEPYVEVGDKVQKGQVMCIVEAMKLMNEIEADTAGVVSGVLVDNAEAVEYGQALFRIDPA